MGESEYIERELDKSQNDIKSIREALFTLIEAQRNTTKNVDNLATDLKEVFKITQNLYIFETRLKELEGKSKKFEDAKVWEYRIFIGAIVGGIVTLVSKLIFFGV